MLQHLARFRFKIIFRYYASIGHIVKSPAKDIVIPNMLMHEYMWSGVEHWHDKVAAECVETGRKLKYSEVEDKSYRLAGFMQRYGLTKGDVIAVILPNVPEYLIVILGVFQAGLTITPVNPIYTSEEIRRQLIRSQTKMIFTLNSVYPTVKQAIDAIPGPNLPVVTIRHTQDESTNEECIKFDEVCVSNYGYKDPGVTMDDICLLPFSSGTTGLPKGVQLTHKNLVVNSLQTSYPEFKLNVDTDDTYQDVVPVIVPMYHMYGLGCLTFSMFARGAKIITLPRFNLKGFREALHFYNASLLFLVPPIVLMLLNTPELKLDKLKSIRTVVSAAAPLGAADIQRFHERTHGKINLLQVYGLSECSPLTHHQSFMLDHGTQIGGSGFALPNTLCKIVEINDPDMKGLAANMTGELFCKGPQVMKGYLNNEEANKQIFTEDGWIRTGDIGHYDEHSHFYITDRLKELIKVKGFPVAPAELEEVLRNHPQIEDAAVIGVPNEKTGEAPKAFIALEPRSKVTAEDIQKYMAENVVEYKQLTGGIEFVDVIPRNPSGKILRKLFRS